MKPPELLHALQALFKEKGVTVKSIDIKRASADRTDLQITWSTTSANEQPSTEKKPSKSK